jgi:hypothetical protein
MCGWPAPVQVAAAAETIKDWLDQQAEAGIDPYVAINTVNTEQILAELRNSEALQVNLALAQTRYNAKEKARLDYLYGGGLAKQNEQRLQRWREQKSRKPVE